MSAHIKIREVAAYLARLTSSPEHLDRHRYAQRVRSAVEGLYNPQEDSNQERAQSQNGYPPTPGQRDQSVRQVRCLCAMTISIYLNVNRQRRTEVGQIVR